MYFSFSFSSLSLSLSLSLSPSLCFLTPSFISSTTVLYFLSLSPSLTLFLSLSPSLCFLTPPFTSSTTVQSATVVGPIRHFSQSDYPQRLLPPDCTLCHPPGCISPESGCAIAQSSCWPRNLKSKWQFLITNDSKCVLTIKENQRDGCKKV